MQDFESSGLGSIPGRGKCDFHFFVSSVTFGAHMCVYNSLSLISRDSRTCRNSGMNFNLEGGGTGGGGGRRRMSLGIST